MINTDSAYDISMVVFGEMIPGRRSDYGVFLLAGKSRITGKDKLILAIADVKKDVGKDVMLLSKESSKGSVTRRNAILDLIRSNQTITIPEIAIIQKVSARTMERDFDWLKDKGIIIREGSRADGRWIIVE